MNVVTDSAYVVNAFRDEWWVSWRKNGYTNSKGKPVANRELWEELVRLVTDERPGAVSFEWVKGHGLCPGNVLVDRLAREAALRQVGVTSHEWV